MRRAYHLAEGNVMDVQGFIDLFAADGVLNAGQESYRGEQKRVSLCQPQDIHVRCEHPTLGERATWPENGWEHLKPCAEKSVVISKKKRSDLQFIAPKQCAKNKPPQCEIRTRPPTLIGERHQFAAHLTITFIPSRAIRASTPSSRATAAIFAASWRSLAVTISEPQCVIIARDTRSFAHQPSWVRTGA